MVPTCITQDTPHLKVHNLNHICKVNAAMQDNICMASGGQDTGTIGGIYSTYHIPPDHIFSK